MAPDLSVAGIVDQLTEIELERILDAIDADGVRSVLLIIEDAERGLRFDALTTTPDGKEALSTAIQLYGVCAIESHRRFVASVNAFRDLYGELPDDAIPGT